MAEPVRLDLAQLTERDLKKIAALGEKVRLTHRWYRSERSADGASVTVYSGDRGPLPYASYRIARQPDGSYALADARSGKRIAEGRTIDAVVAALPDDFFYAARR
jgi:hypothetical protein